MNATTADRLPQVRREPAALMGKDDYFESLLEAPALALPTIALFALAVAIIVGATALTLQGRWPLWAATLANGVAMYTLFSVAHDGSHRAISRYPLVNEAIGRIAIMLLLPIAPFEGVRWIHMQHHRYTNGDRDPDQFVHRIPWYRRPFECAMIDAHYFAFFIRNGGPHFKRNLAPVIAYTIVFVGLIAAATWAGYGLEVLCLWFIASRIGLSLIAFVFIYLPHAPGDVTAQQDPYRASTIRRGWEWLLTPLLVYQNYHLMHHLFPTAPFYNYLKMWHLKYDEFVAHRPAVQSAFGIEVS